MRLAIATLVAGFTALASPALSDTTFCYFETGGNIIFQGRCHFVPQGGGSFKIFDRQNGFGYFANVLVSGPDQGAGYWNGERGANQAHTPLGRLFRVGGCWVNTETRVCAWK